MPKYVVGDMQIHLGVGKEVRVLEPGSVVDLTVKEAETIGKGVQPIPPEKEK
jgi:hypothetical protein